MRGKILFLKRKKKWRVLQRSFGASKTCLAWTCLKEETDAFSVIPEYKGGYWLLAGDMGNVGYKGYLSGWFFTAKRFYFCFSSSHAHLEREVLSSFRPQGCLELSDDQTFGGSYVLHFTAWHFLFHTYTKQKQLTHFALHVSAHPRKHSSHFCSGTARITTEKAVKNNQKNPTQVQQDPKHLQLWMGWWSL